MKPGDLNKAVKAMLEQYGLEAHEIIEKTADEVAEEAVKQLKSNAPMGKRGKYRKGFHYVKLNSKLKVVRRIANKEFRLTHLLEHGHAKQGGGRTDPQPHWEDAEEEAVKAFENRVIERL